MTEQEITDLVRRMLENVAPEIAGEEIDAEETFHDQFELDSMDFLNFVIGIHEETGIDIPEADYPKFANLKGCIAYLTDAGAG